MVRTVMLNPLQPTVAFHIDPGHLGSNGLKWTNTHLLNVKMPYSCVMLCYVMWNYYLQFPNDSSIASLQANQNRPKIKNYVNK